MISTCFDAESESQVSDAGAGYGFGAGYMLRLLMFLTYSKLCCWLNYWNESQNLASDI